MKKVTIKVPAKLNLTLDVVGESKGYHKLNSLVTSISLYDTITVKKRSDSEVKIFEKGISCGCSETDNNAYKTAKLFMQEFSTLGVDITIDKNIPVGGGLGGSSADIVGVLKGMKELYNVTADITYLAEKLGSDTAYMMRGGYCVLSGRGEKITPLDVKEKLYVLLVYSDTKISAKDCFKEFDKQNQFSTPCTDKAVSFLRDGIIGGFLRELKNDLFIPALEFAPQLEMTVYDISLAGAECSLMTGSGSCCYGVYLTKKEMDKAYKKLKKEHNNYLIKTETV